MVDAIPLSEAGIIHFPIRSKTHDTKYVVPYSVLTFHLLPQGYEAFKVWTKHPFGDVIDSEQYNEPRTGASAPP